MKQPSAAVLEARRRFAMHFRRAVLERIERQHEEERASRSPAEINAERDGLIASMSEAGHTLAAIVSATGAKADHVRAVLGLSLEDVQRQQRERERARKRPRAAAQTAR